MQKGNGSLTALVLLGIVLIVGLFWMGAAVGPGAGGIILRCAFGLITFGLGIAAFGRGGWATVVGLGSLAVSAYLWHSVYATAHAALEAAGLPL